jgi:predicted nucleic acid-binding protein
MILADTSVWIRHFRHGDPALVARLSEERVLMHPFISGELACGNLGNRAAILADMGRLPAAALASNSEVLKLIEDRRLWGRGLGWVDVHLLASSLLCGCALWTLDKRLAVTASQLGVASPA